MKRIFKGVVFTNHALERAKERGIRQIDAWATLNNPDSVRNAQDKTKWVYYRALGDRKVEVVANKNNFNQWVVVSIWDKPLPYSASVTKLYDPLWKKVLKGFAGLFRK